MQELRGIGLVEPQCPDVIPQRVQPTVGNPKAAHVRGRPSIEDVDGVTVDGKAHRERAARRERLTKIEAFAVHAEHGDRVAPRVDGEQQGPVRVIDERPLGRQRI